MEREAKLLAAKKKLKQFQQRNKQDTQPTTASLDTTQVDSFEQTIEILVKEKQILFDQNSLLLNAVEQFKILNQKIEQDAVDTRKKNVDLEAALQEQQKQYKQLKENNLLEKLKIEKELKLVKEQQMFQQDFQREKQMAEQADRILSAHQTIQELQSQLKANLETNQQMKGLLQKVEQEKNESEQNLEESKKKQKELEINVKDLLQKQDELEQEKIMYEKQLEEFDLLVNQLQQQLEQEKSQKKDLDNVSMDHKKVAADLRIATERINKLQLENNRLLNGLEERRTRNIQLTNEKVELVGMLDHLKQKSASNELMDLVVIKFCSLDSALKSALNIPLTNVQLDQESLEVMEKQVDQLSVKWRQFLQLEKEHQHTLLLLKNLQASLDRYKKFNFEENERYIQELNSKLAELKMSCDQLNEELEWLNKERSMLKQLLNEQAQMVDASKQEHKQVEPETIDSDPSQLAEEPPQSLNEESQESKQVTANQQSTTPLSTSSKFEEMKSTILAELEGLKKTRSNQEDRIEGLLAKNAFLYNQLEQERKVTTLLQAEVDTLPDYIAMYHQERKALKEQMNELIKKLKFYRKGPTTDQEGSITLWEDTKSEALSELVEIAQREGVSGMVLRVPRELHPCCNRCTSTASILL